jgi:hypothetical protein
MIARTAVVGVSLIGLAGCGVPSTSLTVENKSKAPLTDVVVSLAREVSRTPRITPGQFVNFAKSSSSSGGMCVRYTLGRQRETYGFQYLMGPVPAFCRMTVHDQDVRVSCSQTGMSAKWKLKPMPADAYNCRDIAD